MGSRAAIFSIILVSAIMASATAKDMNPQHSDTNIADFIKSSCKFTQYPQLCVSSLSSYAGSLKPTLSDLVKVAMNVSLVNVRKLSLWAADHLKSRSAEMSEKERAALRDCIQNFHDAVDQIQQSVMEMEDMERSNLNPQMNDMHTFMSAALTDQGSCLNGFEDVKAAGKISAMVKVRVQKESELISNAVALVSAFTASGGDDGIQAPNRGT